MKSRGLSGELVSTSSDGKRCVHQERLTQGAQRSARLEREIVCNTSTYVVAVESVSSPVISLSRAGIVTTPRRNQAKTSRAAAERNAPDVQEFQRVYQENLGPIYRYVYSRVGNREDAEDLTSAVFLKAVEGVDYARPPKMIRRLLF